MFAQLLVVTLALTSPAPADGNGWSKFKINVLHGADACVVLATDRSLRRVDLTTGETTAVASEHMAVEGSPVQIRVIDEERLVTWTSKGPYFQRDAESLRPLHKVNLTFGDMIASIAPCGDRIAIRTFSGRLDLILVAEAAKRLSIPGTPGLLEGLPGVNMMTLPFFDWPVAFSPDGSRLAVIRDEALHLFDSATAELVSQFPIADLPRGEPADFGNLSFYDEQRVLVSWSVTDKHGEDGPMGVDVIRVQDGERIARLVPRGWVWGGDVLDLHCAPELGGVSFSIGSSGFVVSFGADDWKERWQIEYGGGNPNGLWFRRTPGSDRIYISGMMSEYARVLDAVTGENLAGNATLGYGLCGTSNDRFVVCEREDKLIVLDGQTFELLYTRTEGPDGSAWLLRDGVRTDLPAPGPARDSGESSSGDEPR